MTVKDKFFAASYPYGDRELESRRYLYSFVDSMARDAWIMDARTKRSAEPGFRRALEFPELTRGEVMMECRVIDSLKRKIKSK